MSGPSPFPDDGPTGGPEVDPTRRLRAAVSRIRALRSQVGSEGLPPSAVRSLLDELTTALESVARALESSDRTGRGDDEETG